MKAITLSTYVPTVLRETYDDLPISAIAKTETELLAISLHIQACLCETEKTKKAALAAKSAKAESKRNEEAKNRENKKAKFAEFAQMYPHISMACFFRKLRTDYLLLLRARKIGSAKLT